MCAVELASVAVPGREQVGLVHVAADPPDGRPLHLKNGRSAVRPRGCHVTKKAVWHYD